MIDYCIYGYVVYDLFSNKLIGNESSKRNCMVLNNLNFDIVWCKVFILRDYKFNLLFL